MGFPETPGRRNEKERLRSDPMFCNPYIDRATILYEHTDKGVSIIIIIAIVVVAPAKVAPLHKV